MVDLVVILNGGAFAESQIVCDRFGKDHKSILRKIDELIKDLESQDLTAQNCAVKDYFIESTFYNARNREYRNYLMTRDGFSMVAMSLTGSESMKFKVQFIAAFNKMEEALRKQYIVRQVGIETRKTLAIQVDESGENKRMHGHGYSTYTKCAYKLIGIKYVKPLKGERFRDSLSPEDLGRLENVESMMRTLVKAGKEYGEVKDIMEDIFKTKTIKEK